MAFYIMSEDTSIDGCRALDGVPDHIDPEAWIQGKQLPHPSPDKELILELSLESGDYVGDIIDGLLTLYSDDLKDALALAGATERALSVGPRGALADAIGLPASSPASSLIGAYRDRGDGDIADRLLAAKDQIDPPEPVSDEVATDISAILDLL